MGITELFGIELKLLLVQFINFSILLLLMFKFVFPRVGGMLKERQTSIAQALQSAETAKKEAEVAKADQANAAKAAKAEAAKIIAEARATAGAQSAEIVAAAKAESDKVVESARAQLQSEKQNLQTELRTELATLTLATTKQVLESVISEKDSAKMVQAAADHLAALPQSSTTVTKARRGKA